jgi:two-component system, cell cycle response regulator
VNSPENNARIKLLIIEDDEDQRDLLAATLEERFGADAVVGVSSSAAALKLDIAAFDLILSDYNLPDGTGIDLLCNVRERCNTPVILVTGENVGQIAAEAIRQGAMDYVVKVGDYLFTIPLVVEKNLTVAKVKRENEQLRREMEHLLREVRDKNAQLESSLRKVEELAATDPLTALYNRRHFGKVLDQMFSESQRYGSDLSCVMIDLDGYKQINDTFGHAVGDQLLTMAGRVIGSNMRKADVAARYGGDEFVLLLPRTPAIEAAQVVARIREEFAHGSAIILRRNMGLTMSCGVASALDVKIVSGEQLVSAADSALYQSKMHGRDRVTTAAGLDAVQAALESGINFVAASATARG